MYFCTEQTCWQFRYSHRALTDSRATKILIIKEANKGFSGFVVRTFGAFIDFCCLKQTIKRKLARWGWLWFVHVDTLSEFLVRSPLLEQNGLLLMLLAMWTLPYGALHTQCWHVQGEDTTVTYRNYTLTQPTGSTGELRQDVCFHWRRHWSADSALLTLDSSFGGALDEIMSRYLTYFHWTCDANKKPWTHIITPLTVFKLTV